MYWFIKAFKQGLDFSGRARRKEYWMYMLFYILIIFLLFLIFVFASAHIRNEWPVRLLMIFMLPGILPGLAVTIRRLHDIGKSGFWIFIAYVPVIGGIWLLSLMTVEGDYHENKYGPNPKLTKTIIT